MKSYLMILGLAAFLPFSLTGCGGASFSDTCHDSCECEDDADQADCNDACDELDDLIDETGCTDEADDIADCAGDVSCDADDDDSDDVDCDDEAEAFVDCVNAFCEENPDADACGASAQGRNRVLAGKNTRFFRGARGVLAGGRFR
jgi:hypothetical protein